MKERRTYVKAIRMGWGEGSVYFSTEPGTTPDEYVDEICMTQEHTVMGWIYVFKGVKDGRTVFSMYNATNVTLYYKTVEVEEEPEQDGWLHAQMSSQLNS